MELSLELFLIVIFFLIHDALLENICLLREGGGNSGLGESDENPSNFTDLT